MKKIYSALLTTLFIFSLFLPSAFASKSVTRDILVFKSQDVDVNPIQNENQFQKISAESFSFPYTSDVIWFKFPKELFTSNLEMNYILFSTTLAGKLELYTLNPQNQLEKYAQTGCGYPIGDRQKKTISASFELPKQWLGKKDFYVKRMGMHHLDGQVSLMSENEMESENSRKITVFAFYFGAMIILFFYSLSFYFVAKQKDYTWYSLFLLSMGLVLSTLFGVNDFLFPFMNPPPNQYLLIMSSMALFSSLQFGLRFLNSREHCPTIYKLGNVLSILSLVLISVFPVVGLRNLLGMLIDIFIPIGILLLLINAIVATIKKIPGAKYYLLSWIILFCCVMVYFGSYFGLSKQSLMTEYSILWGSLLEMLILGVALATRIRDLEIKKMNAEMRANDRDRYQRLVRVLAHDVANPLTLITLSTGVALKECDSNPSIPETIKKSFLRISTAGDLILSLIDRVRNYESVDLTPGLELTSVSIEEIIHKSEFVLQEKLKAKQICIQKTFKNPDILVLAEATSLLNDVMVNILSNAIKFSDEKSLIEIAVDQTEQSVTVSVKDHGLGIDKENLKYFHRFGSIRSSHGTHGETGSGLGLSLIKSYVELYQGKLEIQSRDRKNHPSDSGVTFIVHLRRASIPYS